MLTCKICDCNCDPSDLINGICDDCRETEQQKQERQKELNRMLNSEFEQTRLEEFYQ